MTNTTPAPATSKVVTVPTVNRRTPWTVEAAIARNAARAAAGRPITRLAAPGIAR